MPVSPVSVTVSGSMQSAMSSTVTTYTPQPYCSLTAAAASLSAAHSSVERMSASS